METVALYRSTGPEDLLLVEQNGFKRWPARLSWQPIFDPISNEQYAIDYARDWNVKDSGKVFVTQFSAEKSFINQSQIHQVDPTYSTEWWISAKDLVHSNDHLVGNKQVIHEFSGYLVSL